MNFSVTIIGFIVMAVSTVMKVAGVEISDEALTQFLTNFMLVVGGFVIYIGRWRQGDITWYGKKINKVV